MNILKGFKSKKFFAGLLTLIFGVTGLSYLAPVADPAADQLCIVFKCDAETEKDAS